jgi:hypothetical protein
MRRQPEPLSDAVALQYLAQVLEGARTHPEIQAELRSKPWLVWFYAWRFDLEAARAWLQENGFAAPPRWSPAQRLQLSRAVLDAARTDNKTRDLLVVVTEAAETDPDARKWLTDHGLPTPKKRRSNKKVMARPRHNHHRRPGR